MNRKRNPLVWAPAGLLLAGSLLVGEYCWNPAVVEAQQSSGATAGTQPTNTDQTQTLSGVIVSMNGARFILRDDDHDTWYHLDNQEMAGKFLGKKVLVTGKLDTRTDMIHVQAIMEAKR